MNSKNSSQENKGSNTEMLDKLKSFVIEHQDVLKNTSGLTHHILIRHLDEACKYNKGYYKNDKGEYIFVKGIEVTNDTGNLLRMGFNGEDNGVWIHISEVNEKCIRYYDVPVFMFNERFDPGFTPIDELLRPTTKDDFEKAVEIATKNIIADYPGAIDPKYYYDIVTEWRNLIDKALADDLIEVNKFPEE